MQILSFEFILFYLVILTAYYLLPARCRYVLLAAAGAYFYASQGHGVIFLLLSMWAVTWLISLLQDRISNKAGKKLLLTVSILFCLAMLGYFKYAGFLTGGRIRSPLLPVGISFYTFQAISYCIDVYRGTIPAEINGIKYLTFLSFFPVILSGPIERAGHLLPQICGPESEKIHFDTDRIRDGFVRILWGCFLKMVLADRLAVMVDTVYAMPESYGGAVVFAASVFYTLQIYCDFAGYSGIAIGIAQTLGITVYENFRAPYLAISIADFWRRWHMTLSGWFRDYLYIPLGGNRKGHTRKLLNIMVVFLVSGLWHGAGWTFILWGALHGLYQVLGDLLHPVKAALRSVLHLSEKDFSLKAIRVLLTFLMVNTAWVLFRAGSIETVLRLVRRLRHPMIWQIPDGKLLALGQSGPAVTLVFIGLALVFFSDLMQEKGIRISEKIAQQRLWIRWPVYILGIMIVMICGMWGTEFDAASFIYYNF